MAMEFFKQYASMHSEVTHTLHHMGGGRRGELKLHGHSVFA